MVNSPHMNFRPTATNMVATVKNIIGHRTAPEVTVALADLSRTTSSMKVLGSYPTALGVAK